MTQRSDGLKGRSGSPGISGGTWRLLIIPVLLIMMLPLGVSAFMFHNDTAHTGVYNDNSGIIPNNVKLWNYSFGGFQYLNASEYTYIMDNSTYASPAVVDGVVYEGSLGGKIRAFDAMTGAVLNTFTVIPLVEGRADDIHSSPAVRDNVVYFTTYDHYLYALNTADFSEHFAPVDIGGAGHSSPAVTSNAVYVGSDNGNISAFSTTTGALLWSNRTNTTAIATPHDRMHSSPAVVNNVVYVGCEDNNVYAFNATTGVKIWSSPTGAPVLSSPAVVDGVVYVGSDDGYLYALNAATGSVSWSYNTFYAVQSTPAVAGSVVYVGNNYGMVYAISTTGSLVWTFTTTATSQVVSSPAVANGIVYVGGYDGKIYAIYANNGTEYWHYTTTGVAPNQIYSSPAVYNGHVYIGGGEGNTNLYAIGNQTILPTAAFTSDVRNGTAPLTVQFTDTSTGSITAYAWDFNNDGTIDNTNPSPTHVYSSVGVYSVNLTVTNGAGSDFELKTNYINVTAAPVTNKTSNVGVFRNSTGNWYLDTTNTGAVNKSFHFGTSGDIPIAGDWDGNGVSDIGVFRPSNGNWYMDTTKTGEVATTFHFGTTGDIPVVGDWDGNGISDVGVFRPSSGNWYLDTTKTGVVNKTFHFGTSGDIPVVGNWTPGAPNVGVFRPSNGNWYIDTTKTGEVATTFHFGTTGDTPVIGDWDGNGVSDIGVFRPSNGNWYMDTTKTGTVATTFHFGTTGDLPKVGNWI